MNSPLPADIAKECKKAAKIIEAFIVPKDKGVDQIIPPQIIAQAKGIAIFTVIKAGFLFSGRGGSGIVVARLDDGSWSAPSAIATGGFGAGGQIGIELTDFVIILNTKDAVKAFSHGGNVTLGGNLSVALGPVGRNAEASGSILNLAPMYSYSVTKGLFVGISLEGSVLIERKDTNSNFYRRKVSAQEILSGSVPPPPAAEDLYRALNRRTEQEVQSSFDNAPSGFKNPFGKRDTVKQIDSTPYRTPTTSSVSSPYNSRPMPPAVPGRLPAPAPAGNRVRALYDFEAQREGDLGFRAGDEIVVLDEAANDWWTGRIGGREGLFPANYVQKL